MRFLTRCRNALIALCLMATLALGACASTSPAYIPTPVPCTVTVPAEPSWPFDNLKPGSDIFTQVATLLADRSERKADRMVIVAAATSCSR